jgi:hypothetical protein
MLYILKMKLLVILQVHPADFPGLGPCFDVGHPLPQGPDVEKTSFLVTDSQANSICPLQIFLAVSNILVEARQGITTLRTAIEMLHST